MEAVISRCHSKAHDCRSRCWCVPNWLAVSAGVLWLAGKLSQLVLEACPCGHGNGTAIAAVALEADSDRRSLLLKGIQTAV